MADCWRRRRSHCRSSARAAVLALLLLTTAAAHADRARGLVDVDAWSGGFDPEPLLIQLWLEKEPLGEPVTAFAARDDVQLPLGALAQRLEFALEISPSAGTARGYSLSTDRLFELDLPGKRARSGGSWAPFDPARVHVGPDDIYVETGLLAEWFPLDFRADLSRLVVEIVAKAPLPLQERKRREKLGRSYSQRQVEIERYPRRDVPYALLEAPAINQTVSLERIPLGGGATWRTQQQTYAAADLLGMNAFAYLYGTSHRPFDYFRIGIGRRDPDGTLLGPLRAREFGLGYVLDPGSSLVSYPQSGWGALVSNFPLTRPAEFDRQSFRGPLPSGWQVELYRNDVLIGFQSSRQDGLYEFLEVPVPYGPNVFRIVLYGPFGQRREEITSVNAADTLAPAGKLLYRVAGNRSDTSSLVHATGLAEYGLGRTLTVFGTASLQESWIRTRGYGGAGLRTSAGPFFGTLEASLDSGGGTALEATLQARLGGIGIQARHAQLDDFVSEVYPSNPTPVRSRTSLRLLGSVPLPLVRQLSLSFFGRHDRYAGDGSFSFGSALLGFHAAGFYLSNDFNWSRQAGSAWNQFETSRGIGRLSRGVGPVALRGELGYDVRPRSQVSFVAFYAQTRSFSSLSLTAGMRRQLQSGQNRYLLGIQHLEGPVGFSLVAEQLVPGGLSATASVVLDVARDPRTGKWYTDARSLAGQGSLSALAFLDANGNGVRDPGEEPVAGAGFQVNGRLLPDRTGADGSAFVRGLPPSYPTGVAVARRTLENALAVPMPAGTEFVPRPGHAAEIDFPIVLSTDINGTVTRMVSGLPAPVGGALIELLGADGKVVSSTRAAFDGFYTLSGVLPGLYVLRVTVGPGAGIPAESLQRVLSVPQGEVLDGFDISLSPAGGWPIPLEPSALPRPQPSSRN